MISNFNIKADEAIELIEFLKPMLEYNPLNRATAE